jgi:hypothetical protein
MCDRPAQCSSNMLTMKGKSNIPPHMRGQTNRQKEMQAQREQIVAAGKPGEDGLPVFNLFVRTKKANVSYYCNEQYTRARERLLVATLVCLSMAKLSTHAFHVSSLSHFLSSIRCGTRAEASRVTIDLLPWPRDTQTAE